MNAFAPAATGCCGPGGLALSVAQARVLALVAAPLGGETVTLAEAAGRVSASPVAARLDLPGFDRAAMDGYAVRCADLMPGITLPVTGRTRAGGAPAMLCPGGAHRIFTGAPVPAGADAVIAQEDVVAACETISICAVPSPGANIRPQGEDVCAGTMLLAAGSLLDWRHVAMLAAQGITRVVVRRRPRVAVLSSGCELAGPGAALAPGQIHDSNLPMLRALLRGCGAEVLALPLVPDNAPAMRNALLAAARDADLVLSTAGISVGEEDHVRAAVTAIGGALSVLKVAMKPGKPLAAGRLGEAVFIGLPGNPLAALAGVIGFVRPLLARMTGAPPPSPLIARAGFALRRRPGRSEFLPVRLTQRGATLWAERTGPDGAARLLPLLAADGLACIPPECAALAPGSPVDVMPFAKEWL